MLVQEGFDLLLENQPLAAQRPKLSIVMVQLQDPLGRLCRHLAGGHAPILTPAQTGVWVAARTAGAPAVGFATTGVNSVKGTPQEGLNLEELLEVLGGALTESANLLLQIRV